MVPLATISYFPLTSLPQKRIPLDKMDTLFYEWYSNIESKYVPTIYMPSNSWAITNSHSNGKCLICDNRNRPIVKITDQIEWTKHSKKPILYFQSNEISSKIIYVLHVNIITEIKLKQKTKTKKTRREIQFDGNKI